jgi:NADPH-dependent curcumin reductase
MPALHLVSRPQELPKDSDFELRQSVSAALVDGQVRVAVSYISIDPAMRVWMSDQKSYWPPVALGEVMRASAIGSVTESRNAKFAVGDHVSGMLGVTSEYVGDASGLRTFDAARLPDLTWALSVFGGTGLTAYFGLLEIGTPKAGEVLVVSAASGAVGSMVCQIGKAMGLIVVGLAGGPEKCAYLRDELGLDGVIDYKNEIVGKRLSELCPQGIDVYFDNVGGDILDSVLKRLKLRARVVLCGGISQYNNTGAHVGPANYMSLISQRARMEGFVVIDYLHRAAEAFAAIGAWAAAGKIKNKVDLVQGLENFPDALRRVYTGKNFGKQLVKL